MEEEIKQYWNKSIISVNSRTWWHKVTRRIDNDNYSMYIVVSWHTQRL